MKISKETQESIQKLQVLEQNLQALMMQKQAFQLELNETENALSEIEKSKDEVYRIFGQVMLKANKDEVQKEIKEKHQILALRLKSIDKQEAHFREEAEKLRDDVKKGVEKH